MESTKDFDACILEKIPCLVKKKLDKRFSRTMKIVSEAEAATCQNVVKKEVMAAILLHGADKFWYGA